MKAERSDNIARFARWSNRLVASPYAPLAALLLIGLGLYALPSLGVPQDRVADLHFLIGIVTLLLVFLLEHNEDRDTTAIHVKLDEILIALDADTRKVGVEELPAEKIKSVRDEERENAEATPRADRSR
jgi:low affinity Fe/Cu permease